jgi:predicted CXXCH cytochrome family protein
MRHPRVILLAVTPLVICGGALAAAMAASRGFPHEVHERLFPVCEGCHAGMRTGDSAEAYPDATACERCHDGTRVVRVDWERPAAQPTNLRFSHTAHLEQTSLAGEPADCSKCHARAGGAGRMDVAPAEPDRCIQCHAHRAPAHLDAAVECSRCHIALTDADAIPLERVAGFPSPLSHGATDFLSTHGPDASGEGASCSVCHARESCERCHPNAAGLAPIAALAQDPRIAALESGRAPEYPLPATHDSNWTLTHGEPARAGIDGCANCHTQPGCTACHTMGDADTRNVIGALADGVTQTAPGVNSANFTTRMHAADIASTHGSAAASGSLECAQCHTQRECATCHAGSRAFHADNFVERHAMEAFGGGGSCQSCHTTETFCRACHERSGLSSTAAMSAAFHDAQPMWLLAHGQAARMSMDTCTSCHRQTDCVRCHSAAGGWGVSPHSRGFAAQRLGERTPQTCAFCHVGDPRVRE